MILRSKNRTLDLTRPQIMGILNVTPDSFSDGGQFNQQTHAIAHARAMQRAGAAIIDIGGESTRPGADIVSEAQELDRVIPVIEALSRELDVWISIDTYKPVVMREACRAGAHLINDINALQSEGALAVAAAEQVPVCLMHMQGTPDTMQQQPQYQNVISEVSTFLQQRAEACLAAGILRENILLDPGFGFGKTLEHNYQLLNQLEKLHVLHYPLLVGMSRKSMIGKLLNNKLEERLAGSLACALLAAQKGAQIIRVHDVQETADVLHVMQAALKTN
ncbi:MAG: dihydropteroate synthase [Plesiomonas sp.]|uniref:dihydropteroate synthase n=1 Tax=Plesiomonas sp. TaxID=2486279 RepID=UPI003F2BE955